MWISFRPFSDLCDRLQIDIIFGSIGATKLTTCFRLKSLLVCFPVVSNGLSFLTKDPKFVQCSHKAYGKKMVFVHTSPQIAPRECVCVCGWPLVFPLLYGLVEWERTPAIPSFNGEMDVVSTRLTAVTNCIVRGSNIHYVIWKTMKTSASHRGTSGIQVHVVLIW